jgi:TolB-like protein
MPLLRKPVVAVMQLRNLSNDPEQKFFVEGLTEDIIGGLSKYSDINVVSRHSSFAATSDEQNVRKFAQSLNARFILSGSVRRQGNRVRVPVELVDAIEDQQIWAEKFDREIDDIFEIQDDIVGCILHAAGGADGVLEKLLRSEAKERPEASFDAYECYLRARALFYLPEGAGYDDAECLFKKAIELDPAFARAHSALAWLLFLRFKYHRKVSFSTIEKEALANAQTATELDANDYRGHWVLAGIYSYQKKLQKSLSSIGRALRSNPNDADLLCWSSGIFLHAERTETALAMCQKAIRLNPNCPDWYWWELGQVYFQQGRYEETLETLEKMTQLGQACRLAAAAAAHLGRSNEAQEYAAAFLRIVPNFSLQEFEATEPFQNPEELERYVSGLRLAGLPE